MARIAADADVEPTRISFVESLRLIRNECEWLTVTGLGSWRDSEAFGNGATQHKEVRPAPLGGPVAFQAPSKSNEEPAPQTPRS